MSQGKRGEGLRVFLARWLFSSLPGITAGGWLRLLRENRFRVEPAHWPRAALITLGSLFNSGYRLVEDLRHRRRLAGVEVKPPLFILGHWRSGTTHLHNLLALDRQLAFPNAYQVFFPHTFLTTERMNSKLYRGMLVRTRLIDNVKMGFRVPYEDEFALCTATNLSPYLAWVFPGRSDRYDRYLTLRDVPPGELARWKETLVWFLKKLTLKHGRPLVLKSPTHTCRIKLLLEMFPEARFVHIHRDPCTVFLSTRRMLEVAGPLMNLQRVDARGLDDHVIDRYRTMYDLFFEERGLIPAGRYHEMAFEDLERDPQDTLAALYRGLGLPGFDALRPALDRYLGSVKTYRKNVHPPLPPGLRERLAREWRRCFEEWGYPA